MTELIRVKGVRTIVLYAWNGLISIKTVLSDVLYVPELKFNLFSIGHALDKGYQLITNSKKCEFLDKDGNVRATVDRCNKLYKLNFEKNNKIGSKTGVSSSMCEAEQNF